MGRMLVHIPKCTLKRPKLRANAESLSGKAFTANQAALRLQTLEDNELLIIIKNIVLHFTLKHAAHIFIDQIAAFAI